MYVPVFASAEFTFIFNNLTKELQKKTGPDERQSVLQQTGAGAREDLGSREGGNESSGSEAAETKLSGSDTVEFVKHDGLNTVMPGQLTILIFACVRHYLKHSGKVDGRTGSH